MRWSQSCVCESLAIGFRWRLVKDEIECQDILDIWELLLAIQCWSSKLPSKRGFFCNAREQGIAGSTCLFNVAMLVY